MFACRLCTLARPSIRRPVWMGSASNGPLRVTVGVSPRSSGVMVVPVGPRPHAHRPPAAGPLGDACCGTLVGTSG